MGYSAIIVFQELDFVGTTLSEYIKIISSSSNSTICTRKGELYNDENKMPPIDYELEIEKLKREISYLNGQKPDSEDERCQAVIKGDVETKNGG